MPEYDAPFLLVASPRRGGNCDFAASLYAQGLKEGGLDVAPVYLRDYECLPCVACGACAVEAGKGMALDTCVPQEKKKPWLGCPLSLRDRSRELLVRLMAARHVCIVSPIYFYHLPGQLKIFIDRLQPFWELAQAGDRRLFSLPARKFQVVLLAAREKGETLFEGSLKTLKYALANINMEPAEPLLLYGLDRPGDLREAADRHSQLVRCGREGAVRALSGR